MSEKICASPKSATQARHTLSLFSPQRRHFIEQVSLLLASPVAVALAAGCTPDNADTKTSTSEQLTFFTRVETDTLTKVAQTLFPHDSLPPDTYARVAIALDKLANANVDLGDLLRRSIAALDEQVGGAWLTAAAHQQLVALEQWQRNDHFGLILNTSIDTLYRDPDVWQLIGYEGSSLEHGGYLNRGFDDIDWLDNAPRKFE